MHIFHLWESRKSRVRRRGVATETPDKNTPGRGKDFSEHQFDTPRDGLSSCHVLEKLPSPHPNAKKHTENGDGDTVGTDGNALNGSADGFCSTENNAGTGWQNWQTADCGVRMCGIGGKTRARYRRGFILSVGIHRLVASTVADWHGRVLARLARPQDELVDSPNGSPIGSARGCRGRGVFNFQRGVLYTHTHAHTHTYKSKKNIYILLMNTAFALYLQGFCVQRF